MRDVWSIFEPGNTALQVKDMHLGKAVEIVTMCISVLRERRTNTDTLFEELMLKTTEICEQNKMPVPTATTTTTSENSRDFIVDGTLSMPPDTHLKKDIH